MNQRDVEQERIRSQKASWAQGVMGQCWKAPGRGLSSQHSVPLMYSHLKFGACGRVPHLPGAVPRGS